MSHSELAVSFRLDLLNMSNKSTFKHFRMHNDCREKKITINDKSLAKIPSFSLVKQLLIVIVLVSLN